MSFRASVVCKDNYAATVQKIMPAEVRPERLADRGDLYGKTISGAMNSHQVAINPHLNRELGLTAAFICHIIIFTDERTTECLMAKKPKPDRKQLVS